MKKSKKAAIIIAVIAIVSGVIMVFSAFAMSGFELGKIKIGDTVTYTVDFDEIGFDTQKDVLDIKIDCVFSNVTFKTADNESLKVEYDELEGVKTNIEVNGYTLNITEKDERGWFERIMLWNSGNPNVTVYLPEDNYGKVYVSTVSGNIEAADEEYMFRSFYGLSVSGNISVENPVIAEIECETVSGNICANGINTPVLLDGDQLCLVRLKTVSGDIEFTGAEIDGSDGVVVTTTSGNINMASVYCKNAALGSEYLIKSTSGNITIENSDVSKMNTESTSGNITASLSSPIKITTETVSGEVEVLGNAPESKKEFNAETVSGNIKISVIS